MKEQQEENISKKRLYKAYENGGPNVDDPRNLSMSIDWRELRQQRKLKLNELKGKAVKPSNNRAGMINYHKKVARQLEGDDTVDTKNLINNQYDDELSNQFAKSYNGRF